MRLLPPQETNKIIRQFKSAYSIKAHEIRFAHIKENIPNCPSKLKHLLGCKVEIIFFGYNTCEVLIFTDDKEFQGVKYLDTKFINFYQKVKEPVNKEIEVGELVFLQKHIIHYGNILGYEGEQLVILEVKENKDYPYFVYSTWRKKAYYVNASEIKRKRRRMHRYIR